MTSNQIGSQELYPLANAVTFSNPFVTYFSTRDPGTNDVNFPVQKRWFNTLGKREWILVGYSNVGGTTTAIWDQVSSGGAESILDIVVPEGTSPVLPTGAGALNFTSNDESLFITGSTNTIDFGIVGGPAITNISGNLGELVIPNAAGQVNIIGATNSISTTGNAMLPSGNILTLSVSPTYPGQTSITTLGTITTGIWDASDITVPYGGTGVSSFTINAPIFGGTTSTGPLQSGSNGTAGWVLTSNGASTIPTFQTIQPAAGAFTGVNVQTFSVSGNYTPHANLVFATIELIGGGGGSGGCASTTGSQNAASGGGGAGGYCRLTTSAGVIGAGPVSITIGAAGAAGTAGNNVGGTGGTTSFGILCSATGGVGGNGGVANSNSTGAVGGAGGLGSGGNVNAKGQPGGSGQANYNATTGYFARSGFGGNSYFGGGGSDDVFGGAGSGNPAISYGGGAGGCIQSQGAAAQAGAAGAAGFVIITEYFS